MNKNLSNTERLRNERLQELYRDKQMKKASQNQDITFSAEELTQKQMEDLLYQEELMRFQKKSIRIELF